MGAGRCQGDADEPALGVPLCDRRLLRRHRGASVRMEAQALARDTYVDHVLCDADAWTAKAVPLREYAASLQVWVH